jgi:hypothetical protein
MKRELPSTLDKPVLDEETFHQLLSAAYTLQEHNPLRFVKDPKEQGATYQAGKHLETVAFKRPQSKPAQLLPLVQRAVPCATSSFRYRIALKRVSQSHELFWGAAMVVAAAALSALLLVGMKAVVMEPAEAAKTGPTERTVIGGKPRGIRETPASRQRTTVNPNGPHSTYESEADVVAKDTVVRYGKRSAAPHLQAVNPNSD